MGWLGVTVYALSCCSGEPLEHGEQAGTSLGLQVPHETDTSGRGATSLWCLVVSHRSLASVLFCSTCIPQEKEWLSLGCVARGEVRGRF